MSNRTMSSNDPEVGRFIEHLQRWHGHKVGQLREIVAHPGCDIVIEDKTIPADSELAKGIRFGVELSLLFLGDLPFTASKKEAGESDG